MIKNSLNILIFVLLFIIICGCVDNDDKNNDDKNPFLRIGLKNFSNEIVSINVSVNDSENRAIFHDTIMLTEVSTSNSIYSIYLNCSQNDYSLTLNIDDSRTLNTKIQMFDINTNYEYAIYENEIKELSGSL